MREFAQRHEAVAHLVVGDREDRVLGLIEDDVGFFRAVVRGGEDLVRREDQIPEGGFFLDDARVVLDVHRPRHAVDQRRDIRGAADFVELAGAAELVFERHEIDGAVALRQRDHLVEDAAVGVPEEVSRVDHLRRQIECVVVEQDGAENRSLRLQIVRKRSFGREGFGH